MNEPNQLESESDKNKISPKAKTFLIVKDIIILEIVLVLFGFSVYYSFKNNMDRSDQLGIVVFFCVLLLFAIVNLLKNATRNKK